MASNSQLSRGHHLSQQTKEVVYNVFKFMSNQYNDLSVQDIVAKTSLATGCSTTTVFRIKREFNANKTLSQPKRRPGKEIKYKVNPNDKQLFKELMNDNYYSKGLLPPCILDVHKLIKGTELSFADCGYRIFVRILRELNYRLVKVEEMKSKIIMERPDKVVKKKKSSNKSSKTGQDK